MSQGIFYLSRSVLFFGLLETFFMLGVSCDMWTESDVVIKNTGLHV